MNKANKITMKRRREEPLTTYYILLNLIKNTSKNDNENDNGRSAVIPLPTTTANNWNNNEMQIKMHMG